MSVLTIAETLKNSGCLYLHGFLSSPASEKAQQMLGLFEQHPELGEILTPELTHHPVDAIALAEAELSALQQQHEKVWLVGSSLGGFYATYLAEKFKVPAVLINPAVRPHELFRHYIGDHKHFHTGEPVTVEDAHLDQLQALSCTQIQHPEQLLLLLQTGDETLDYRQAAALYRDCPAWIEGGGNHSFIGFEQRFVQILAHLQRCFS